MKQKLDQGRFRMLNEMFYTTKSDEIKTMVDKDEELLHIYHRGYRSQVEKWPVRPLELIIKELSSSKGLVIGDFGCGDAALAERLSAKHTVHSFDMVAINDRVTPCDISNVPLDTGVLDVAVFSLSLMGPNYAQFIKEACRCLRKGGRLIIAEVSSRMAGRTKDAFVEAVIASGFKLSSLDDRDYFVLMKFAGYDGKGRLGKFPELKACTYKKR
ncbi:Methyltransferase-related [Carpediemonas membranifera]|uniref:Ribosomal RNA-processing protein 8 n=1 Tax=Carpediemonas membranifera TaxID=201153 RepID=A0A8J6ARY7_9EUKA|nr:Methyltransferase-related [Carpediemonas membranifera]|eukprot:KAG9392533.1 Methyltransferase-related [Carpediemonas membranifera]